jgi:hypothetical protein
MADPFTVVAIVAAYNEADIIGEAIGALIADGIQVYVIDHMSTDGTATEVEPYLGRGVIGIEQFSGRDAGSAEAEGFGWERILRRKEGLSRELAADWFIHHDADEFRESPWPSTSLRTAIERVDAAGYNAIDFEVLNFAPTTDTEPPAGRIRDTLRYYEPAQLFDRVQIKCWKNTGLPVDLASSGGHDVTFAGRRVFPIRFLLRHYPIRSQSHGERKVLRERVPRFLATERARGWHVQYDDLEAGASFVRDPTPLVAFDPDAVRLNLLLRNREVERLEALAAAGQQAYEELRDGFDRLKEHLARQDDELAGLRPCVAAQHEELQQLHAHVRSQNEEVKRLRADVEARGEERERLRNDLAARDEELERRRGDSAIRDEELQRLHAAIGAHTAAAAEEAGRLRAALAAADGALAAVLQSKSWKLTAFLRAAQRLVSGK